MRKITILAVLSLLVSSFYLPQNTSAGTKPLLWASDCLTKVMRNETPPDQGKPYLYVAGARGEIVSGQAVYNAGKPLDAATVSVSDLKHQSSGKTIPSSSIKLQWIRYIDISRNSDKIPDDELVAKAPASIPDPFWEDTTIPVQYGTQTILNNSAYLDFSAQPIWIEIQVPDDADTGDYSGILTVTGGDEPAQLPVTLHVWNLEMPQERHLSMINWWTFPGMGFENIIIDSKEYWDLLEQYTQFVVEHRQTDVWTDFEIIKEQGDAVNGYTYDTSKLERFAELVFSHGIQKIHIHQLGEKTAYILEPKSRIAPIEKNLRKLGAVEKLIKRKGWEKRFLAAISDEPFIHHESTYAALVERAHKIAPNVRLVEALEAEYLGKLDIYVPKLSHLNMWYPRFDEVRKEGSELWFYTCCHPMGRYPNRFLDQSLLKVRVLHWLNYLYDLKGYLHWGLNMQWNDNGSAYTMEAISKDLPLGDRAVAYPGKMGLLGSLRFSAQRDGLQDYEYLWTLENKIKEIKNRVGEGAFWLNPRQRPLEFCRRVIWSFHDYTRDSNVMLDTRRAIAEEIEALDNEPLLLVQTSPPEGSTVPEGPRFVLIRGLVTPGAKVEINEKPVENIEPSGYFYHYHFLQDNKPTITIKTEFAGKKKEAKRTFKLED